MRALTRQEAQALAARSPSVSPWKVVAVQAVLGVGLAALVWLVTGERAAGLSALYGAAVVVVPAVLMARGMTSRFSSVSPGATPTTRTRGARASASMSLAACSAALDKV